MLSCFRSELLNFLNILIKLLLVLLKGGKSLQLLLRPSFIYPSNVFGLQSLKK